MDRQQMQATFQSYIIAEQKAIAERATRDFLTEVYWGTCISKAGMKELSMKLPAHAAFMTPGAVTDLAGGLKSFDLSEIAEKCVDSWLEGANTSEFADHIRERGYWHTREFHPRIEQKLREIERESREPVDLMDAVITWRTTGQWNQNVHEAVERSTESEVNSAVRSLSGEKLADFVMGVFGLGEISGDGAPKRQALSNWLVSALQEILSESPTSRLAVIAGRVLEARGIRRQAGTAAG